MSFIPKREEKDKHTAPIETEDGEEEEGVGDRRNGDENDASGEYENGDDDLTRGAKRRRINADEYSLESGYVGRSAQAHTKRKNLPRDVIPCSIPGSHLDMIVCPNGAGKRSSIAGAIALGLNSLPPVLGRSTALDAFVKNGPSSGHVEIELKGPAGKQNIILRGTLSASSKSSIFRTCLCQDEPAP
ncbi:hypothetical protein K443DRAFT_7250 [Laccaria amethystina LaAM-08-1]|uniref:Structural maintenance of chromosomes protein 5 n=1 Tax=Laccaria amethystina LaAM-08-1 TaxID=1095629 RepID=A0A0C9XTJ2_9AGAR|nr:hypothetical protein K443DRAFT_7250 [Laccaria amethystina LaAM-08-1]